MTTWRAHGRRATKWLRRHNTPHGMRRGASTTIRATVIDEGTGFVVGQTLTRREGRSQSDGPYEGVPQHLNPPIRHWLDGAFGCPGGQFIARRSRTAVMLAVAATCRVPLNAGAHSSRLYNEIIEFCNWDQEQFLDVVHATIQLTQEYWSVEELEEMLAYGGSAWTATKTGLQRRVEPVAQTAYDNAVSQAHDPASDELAEAWRKAYGREPDPSDAWDHSIKAVEAVLIPIVVPTQDKPHLGHVLGQLDRQDARWQLLLTAQQGITPMETLVGMLRLIYPNPDRHPGPERRVPMLEEAQAAVHLAVTIVQWGRAGVLRRLP